MTHEAALFSFNSSQFPLSSSILYFIFIIAVVSIKRLLRLRFEFDSSASEKVGLGMLC